ncbi:MAG: DUF5666 domain-containing protein [Gemmatimonadota bacterium]
MRRYRTSLGRCSAALVLLAAAASTAAPVAGQEPTRDPHLLEEDSWVSIDGQVQAVMGEEFRLDYGDGTIRVEMDELERWGDGYELRSGDAVTVSGLIDDDFFSSVEIEARTVYVERLGTYFYVEQNDDEEDWFTDPIVSIFGPVEQSRMIVQGTVTEVSGDEFTLNTGTRRLTVDVDEMERNPLDEDGLQRVDVGDQVSVTGRMDRDLFEARELEAETVHRLRRERDPGSGR